MVTETQIQELNKSFEKATPTEIIKKAFELNNKAVVTTNFRPYEAVIYTQLIWLKIKYQ